MTAKQVINEEAGSGKRWVKCREGWISYSPSGENFYVTATGHRAMTVHGSELKEILAELIQALGGRA